MEFRLNRPAKVWIAVVCLIAAAAYGVWSANGWKFWLGQDRSVRCAGDICVGYEASNVPKWYNADKIGGFHAIFCGPDGHGEFIFLNEILNGKRCDNDALTYEFRTEFGLTEIQIERGKVSKIVQKRAHDIFVI